MIWKFLIFIIWYNYTELNYVPSLPQNLCPLRTSDFKSYLEIEFLQM